MKKIAHLKVTCPQCGKYTSIYVTEDGGRGAKVKCEHCRQVFEFGAGMMYEPVAYVPAIPNWAIIKETDKVHSVEIKCRKCGKHYTEMDIGLGKTSSPGQGSDDMLSSLLLNAIKAEAGLTVLYKCSFCGQIACSACAVKSDNAFGGKCPYCDTNYTIYSRIEPTAENVLKEARAKTSAAKSPKPAQPNAKIETTAPQADALPAQSENPMRAVWVMGSALIFILLAALSFTLDFSRSYDVTRVLAVLSFPLVMGTAVYLMQQGETKYKVFSGVGLVFGTVIYAFSITYLTLFASTLKAPPIGRLLRHVSFTTNLRVDLMIAVAVGTIALIVSLAHKGQIKQRLMLSAWLGVVVVFVIRQFNLRNWFLDPAFPAIRKVGIVVENIEIALCVALFAFLVYALCNLKQKELRTGTGAKVWFCLCILFTAGSIIVSVVGKTMGIAGAVIGLVGVVGYILLLASKRVGFPVVLVAVTMNVLAGVAAGLSGNQPSVSTALASLVGLLNPLITWLLVRNLWGKGTDAMGMTGQAVRTRSTQEMKKSRMNYILTASSIFITLLFSLFLTFAKNERYPNYSTTGLGLLSFNTAFFQDEFKVVGIIAGLIFLAYFLIMIGSLVFSLLLMISNDPKYTKRKNLLLAAPISASVMVFLAVITVYISKETFPGYSYSTEYWLVFISTAFMYVMTLLNRDRKKFV